MSAASPREQGEIARANASGLEPVGFVHGLWLLASSWVPLPLSALRAAFPVLGNPASYMRQRRNPGITEIREIPDRGHSRGGRAPTGAETLSARFDPTPDKGA